MGDLITRFTRLALLRGGPQDLPASALLLGLTVLAYLGVNALVSSLFPPDAGWFAELVLDIAFTMAWYAVLLKVAGRQERTLQTLTAVFGFQLVLAPLLITLQWLVQRLADDTTWDPPLLLVWLALFGWMIAANTRIVRAALEWSTPTSVTLVILQILAGELLRRALLLPLKS
jgi:drug/metabolite transporter (DMT)-like permease